MYCCTYTNTFKHRHRQMHTHASTWVHTSMHHVQTQIYTCKHMRACKYKCIHILKQYTQSALCSKHRNSCRKLVNTNEKIKHNLSSSRKARNIKTHISCQYRLPFFNILITWYIVVKVKNIFKKPVHISEPCEDSYQGTCAVDFAGWCKNQQWRQSVRNSMWSGWRADTMKCEITQKNNH